VLDTSKVGIYVLDSEFKIVWINHAIETYFGFKRENILGIDKRELVKNNAPKIIEKNQEFQEKLFAAYENNTYIAVDKIR